MQLDDYIIQLVKHGLINVAKTIGIGTDSDINQHIEKDISATFGAFIPCVMIKRLSKLTN